MPDRRELVSALGQALRERGLEGRGRYFRFVGPELAWFVDLDLIPHTDRVGTIVGVCPAALAPNGWPTRANNCPIVLAPDSGGEPFGLDHWEMWQALSADSDLTDDARREALQALVEAVVGVVRRVQTLEELKAIAASGQLRGFLHKDARSLLAGS